MPQITQCPHCRRQLQVRDENLGQTIRCPLCNGLFKIAAPQAPPPPPSPPPPPAVDIEVIEPPAPPPAPPSPPPPPPPPPSPAMPKARPSGAARKPVPKPAPKLPQKARPTPAPPPPKAERPRRPKAPPPAAPPVAAEEESPFAPGHGGGAEPVGGPPAAEEDNPFAAGGPLAGALGGAPAAPSAEQGEAKPHRGKMILGLGIAGLVLSLCCFPAGYALGGCATVMGGRDLRLMARRRMDRAGQRPTRTGQILGIAALVLSTIDVLVVVWRVAVHFSA